MPLDSVADNYNELKWSCFYFIVKRFYDPDEGVVRLDGVDVRDINLKYLRSQIGLVSQEPVLFNASVRDNVATPRRMRIRETCVRANAHSFVEKLPQGYDTVVAERGFLLSGGQKQRIAIVADPKILLLDDATSVLDTQSEGVVQNALDNLRAARTPITIAHRLPTIKDANAIYVMADGVVLEQGTHSELLADSSSMHSQLVEAQKLRDEKDPTSESVLAPGDRASDAGTIVQSSSTSLDSLQKEVARPEQVSQEVSAPALGLFDLFIKLAQLNRESWRKYIFGAVFAIPGAVFVSRGECTTFQFFITLMAATFGSLNAGNIFSFALDLSTAKTAGLAIMWLLESVSGMPPPSQTAAGKDSEKPVVDVKFDNIHFSYPTRPGIKVLRGLSFETKPGEYIAHVAFILAHPALARIQLIERLYEHVAGQISLDGIAIDTLAVQDYRSRMALVSQEPTLYAGTVRFNILLGALKPKPEVVRQEIEDACRDANILEFIESLPKGFETEVGSKGSQLSGRQRQRIAIARALMQDLKVLLLNILRMTSFKATPVLTFNSTTIDTALLVGPKAREITYLLVCYPDVVHMAFKLCEPSTIVTYCFKLSHTISSAWETLIVRRQVDASQALDYFLLEVAQKPHAAFGRATSFDAAFWPLVQVVWDALISPPCDVQKK
ncbi:P-loop containing nucleoside triphosphate hydrolase protein [Mycena vulgaris]|nr:P-loop containing nucleoside triphosphate hydrolase protein [Mycena vulgaris]